MRTVCVVVTARPSYARVKTVLEELTKRGDVKLQVVVAGSALLQRYGRVIEQMQRDFPRQHFTEIYTTLDGDTHGTMVQSASILASSLANELRHLRPDVVVTIADRYETLGTAMAASYLNIPLAHIQGGEITGSIDDKVRNAVTQLADLHFTATENATQRVCRMLQHGHGVLATGCPSIDLAADVKRTWNPAQPFNPFEGYGGTGPKFDVAGGYYVLLQHPVTTHAETARAEMVASLQALRHAHLPVFCFWPNIDAGTDAISKVLREFREQMHVRWHYFRHLEASDFLRLLMGADALVGNSSVGIRECSYLGVPVVNIGDRQMGRERGPNVIDCDPSVGAITAALQQHSTRRPQPSSLYGNGTAGSTIASLLAQVPL